MIFLFYYLNKNAYVEWLFYLLFSFINNNKMSIKNKVNQLLNENGSERKTRYHICPLMFIINRGKTYCTFPQEQAAVINTVKHFL